MIMMCQCRFIDYNKDTISVGNSASGEAVHVLGQEAYGKSLYLLLNLKKIFGHAARGTWDPSSPTRARTRTPLHWKAES